MPLLIITKNFNQAFLKGFKTLKISLITSMIGYFIILILKIQVKTIKFILFRMLVIHSLLCIFIILRK